MRKIAVSLALCLLLAGCGQTGVQPEDETVPQAPQAPTVVLPEEDWEEAHRAGGALRRAVPAGERASAGPGGGGDDLGG